MIFLTMVVLIVALIVLMIATDSRVRRAVKSPKSKLSSKLKSHCQTKPAALCSALENASYHDRLFTIAHV